MKLTISMCNFACQRQMVYVHAVDLLLRSESLNGPAHTHIYLLQYVYNANNLFFIFFFNSWQIVSLSLNCGWILAVCYIQTSGRSLMN